MERIIELLKSKGVLSAEEEAEVFRYYEENPSVAMRNLIVEKNMGLVRKASVKYLNLGIDQEELIQEGVLGLMEAVRHYEWERGTRFSTYAMNWICQAMGRYIANNALGVRYPAYVITSINKINRIKKQYEMKNGRAPGAEYIAKETGLPIEKVRAYEELDNVSKVDSLDREINSEDEKKTELGQMCRDKKAETVFKDKEIELDLEKVRELMEEILTSREMDILFKRYGLFGYEPQTLEELGCEAGVSKERIRQLEHRAMSKLRRSYRFRRKLTDYC